MKQPVMRVASIRLIRRIGLISLIIALSATPNFAQESRAKIRISNSAFSVTSLPLLAARKWKLFHERALDSEIILMSPAITVPAMISGEVDYVAGVGPDKKPVFSELADDRLAKEVAKELGYKLP